MALAMSRSKDTNTMQQIRTQDLTPLLQEHSNYTSSAGGKQLDMSGKEFIDCDFSNQVLHSVVGARVCNFTRCNFSHADLYGISFQGSRFVACNFNQAMLSKSEFWGVNVIDSTFDDAIMIRAEFIGATVHSSSFLRANLLGSALTQSTLTGCIFDAADLTGAAVSDNKETDVSWKNVTGYVAKATAQAAIEKLFFSVIDNLIACSFSDANVVAKILGTSLTAASETEYFRTLMGGEKQPMAAAAGLTFTDVELRQNKQDKQRAILIATLSKSICIARNSVLKKFASPSITPPHPASSDALGYIAFEVQGMKVSFGFTQSRPDCVASVVVDRL
jgi:uncharacterized protein YjbI with pentapeptide repeats